MERTGFEDVVIRCKEAVWVNADKLRIDDSTIRYSLSNGQFTRRANRGCIGSRWIDGKDLPPEFLELAL